MADFYSGWLAPPNGFAKFRLHLSVRVSSQNQAANTTTLFWSTTLEKDRSQNGFYGYNAAYSTTINGTFVMDAVSAMPPRPWTGWGTWTIGDGYITVTHNTDGTKTISVAGAYVGANTGWAIGTVALAGNLTMALPRIARATVPKVTPSPANVGDTVAITLLRAVGTYTHDVTWKSGALSGTIGTGLGVSTGWTVPDVMGQFPGQKLAPIVIRAVTKIGATVIGENSITLRARAVPIPPTPEDLDPSRRFDVRVRLVEFGGAGDWGARKVIPTETLQMVDAYSATATCSFTLSDKNYLDFPEGAVVDVEVFDGTDWIFTNHRFVMSRNEGDDVDPLGMRSYSGVEFVDFGLGLAYSQRGYYWDRDTQEDDAPIKHAAPTSPGNMMAYAIADRRTTGALPRLTHTFSTAKTTFGDAWVNPSISRGFAGGTPLSQMLDGLVSDGLCEYRTEYRDNVAHLVLLNPGTGSDFSATGSDPVVNLALAPLTRAPRRSTSESRFTRVTVAGDEGVLITNEKTPFNPNVFGHLEGWVAASGVTTNAAASAIASNAIRDNNPVAYERTFEYASADATPQYFPYSTFRPGDWVLIPQKDNAIRDRVAQVTIDKAADQTITLTVLTGDRILSGVASLSKRQKAQSGGAVAGGTQVGATPLDARIPAGPEILSVTSAGYWNSDGAAQSAVTISWAPVVTALSKGAIAVDLYEVWWRPAGTGTEWIYRSSTEASTIVLPDWGVLQNIELRVRGRSKAGVFGEFSENQSHVTQAPPVDLDGPVMTDLYTDGVGNIFAVWAGVLGTTTAPARLAYVVAEVSGNQGLSYTTMGTPIVGPGSIVVNPGAYGNYLVRLRGYDRLGNAGDASDAQEISLTDPRVDAVIPEAPTNLTAVAGAAWDASGFLASAWFDLAWDAPTTDTSGDPIEIGGYDVWGKKDTETVLRFITSTSINAVRVPVNNDENWSFQVAAISTFGGVSALSEPVIASADATIAPPTPPDAPVLSQYAGLLRIQWAGEGMVPQVKYVYASISTTIGGQYTRAGMPLVGAGEVVVPGLATGETYYAKIVLVDERGQEVSSEPSNPITLTAITGITVETSPLANTGIKITTGSLTSYDASGQPTFILNAATGEVWIAPYDAVFNLGASGTVATTGAATTGIAISSESSSFNTFIHSSGVEIRNDQTPLSWWEADASDASLVNFFSPRAVVGQRLLLGDYEMTKELKATGSRLVIRYKGD